MDTATFALGMFAAGMAFEGLRLLGLWRMEKRDFIKFLGCLAFSVFLGLVEGLRGETDNGLYLAKVFGLFLIIFPFLYLLMFKKKVFPAIGERILLVWSVLFVYVISRYSNTTLTVIVTAISLAIIVLLVANKKMPKAAKTIFYLWYIIIVAVFGALQFDIEALFRHIDAAMFFIKGMASLYLMMCIWQIAQMVPLPAKNQSMSSRMAEWHDDVNFMARKFSDRQVPPGDMALTAAAAMALIAANAYFNFVSLPDLISLMMVLPAVAAGIQEGIKNTGTIAAIAEKP